MLQRRKEQELDFRYLEKKLRTLTRKTELHEIFFSLVKKSFLFTCVTL